MQGDQVHVDQLSRPAPGATRGRQVSPRSAVASRRTELGRAEGMNPNDTKRHSFMRRTSQGPRVEGGDGSLQKAIRPTELNVDLP